MAAPDGPLVSLLAGEYDEALRCVKCGFCLQACPTYRQTGIETASPRGRLALVRAMMEGQLPPGPAVADPLALCLGCRACEPACPSGVRYGRVLEGVRAALEPVEDRRRSAVARLVRRVGFATLARPRRLRRLAGLLALTQRTGLIRLSGVLPRHLREMATALPPAPTRALRREWESLLTPLPEGGGWRIPARGRQRYRVGFFPGCVMDSLFLAVNLATVRVLAAAGCEVIVPARATCCGALHAHSGHGQEAERLARLNIAAFSQVGPLDAIINNAGGCGAHLKEYGHLLAGAALPEAEAATAFVARTRDVSEWLMEIGLGEAEGRLGPLPWTVTYQPSCHLENGQGVRHQPRELLQAIPGLKVVEMKDAERCCGSAGIYNLTQPEMATALLDEKMENVAATEASVVVVTNPGCHLQMRTGVHRAGLAGRMQVYHLVELLDRSLA